MGSADLALPLESRALSVVAYAEYCMTVRMDSAHALTRETVILVLCYWDSRER